jgi:hypothetical protein
MTDLFQESGHHLFEERAVAIYDNIHLATYTPASG